MPQCQRSANNTILDAVRHRLTRRVWVCPGEPYSPGCPGGEVYVDVSGTTFARACLLEEAIARCDAEFGPSSNRRPRLWLGGRPLTVRNKSGSVHIYLKTASNRDQHRYQCAHEVFHARHGPGTMHWTHELLAVHFSLLHLHAEGYKDYAHAQEAELEHDASLIRVGDLLAWDEWPTYPPAEIYGRVFVLGRELIAATSWADVRRLVSGDFPGWLASLDGPARRRVAQVVA